MSGLVSSNSFNKVRQIMRSSSEHDGNGHFKNNKNRKSANPETLPAKKRKREAVTCYHGTNDWLDTNHLRMSGKKF